MTPIRRAILQRLAQGWADTSALERAAACSATDVQRTLRELARCDLITADRRLTPAGAAYLHDLERSTSRTETR